MSSYISFYVKRKDVYAPIGSFCRSHIIYRYFQAVYDDLAALTKNKINTVIEDLEIYKNDMKDSVQKYKNKLHFITTMSNTVEEKLVALQDIDDTIDEIEAEISECEFAINFCHILNIMMDEHYSHVDIKEDEYIYYGIDIDDPMEKNNA